ncbi:MAG: zinc ribbon domain-containing protein, partial [Clostridia bacterium]|nr:zinc ribbon domain-containing protein [Clostridia bacterium]
MFCKNCGMQLADDAKFCGACGAVLDAAPVSEETTILDQPPVE